LLALQHKLLTCRTLRCRQ